MRFPTLTDKLKAAAIAAPLALAGALVAPPSTQQAGAGPAHASFAAVYDIRFAGIRLGKFEVWSNLNSESYSMRGKGELKFITGLLFEIKGGTTSRGSVTENGPKPDQFAFEFETKKHTGELAMLFEKGAVAHVMAKPPFVDSPKDIPVTSEHVKGVLDPMSALFFTAKSENSSNGDGSVCPGHIPVFDGKQRFDLKLSYKKTVQVKKRGKGGYGGAAVVCRIKYTPIAGYKPDNSGVQYMAESDDIEVWLIKVPRKTMYVPYHVSLPTPYGTASATSTGFQVEIPGHKKITLIQ